MAYKDIEKKRAASRRNCAAYRARMKEDKKRALYEKVAEYNRERRKTMTPTMRMKEQDYQSKYQQTYVEKEWNTRVEWHRDYLDGKMDVTCPLTLLINEEESLAYG
jgi:hypothetical protein